MATRSGAGPLTFLERMTARQAKNVARNEPSKLAVNNTGRPVDLKESGSPTIRPTFEGNDTRSDHVPATSQAIPGVSSAMSDVQPAGKLSSDCVEVNDHQSNASPLPTTHAPSQSAVSPKGTINSTPQVLSSSSPQASTMNRLAVPPHRRVKASSEQRPSKATSLSPAAALDAFGIKDDGMSTMITPSAHQMNAAGANTVSAAAVETKTLNGTGNNGFTADRKLSAVNGFAGDGSGSPANKGVSYDFHHHAEVENRIDGKARSSPSQPNAAPTAVYSPTSASKAIEGTTDECPAHVSDEIPDEVSNKTILEEIYQTGLHVKLTNKLLLDYTGRFMKLEERIKELEKVVRVDRIGQHFKIFVMFPNDMSIEVEITSRMKARQLFDVVQTGLDKKFIYCSFRHGENVLDMDKSLGEYSVKAGDTLFLEKTSVVPSMIKTNNV